MSRSSRQHAREPAPTVTAVPPLVREVLQAPGRPLEPATRGRLESRFGCDFSGVRVHADDRAAASARALDAHAYTVGSHVVFDAGRYAPATSAGQRLLAHELTHVVQQGATTRDTPSTPASGVAPLAAPGDPASPLEAEADRIAGALDRGGALTVGSAAGPGIQRQSGGGGAGGGGGTGGPLGPLPPWLNGVTPIRRVGGDVFEIELTGYGRTLVGPYNQLGQYRLPTEEAHHVVGREHLADVRTGYTDATGPSVLIDRGIHNNILSVRITAEQRELGGRRGGRATVTAAEVASLYRSVYTFHTSFRELATIAENVLGVRAPAAPPGGRGPTPPPSGGAPGGGGASPAGRGRGAAGTTATPATTTPATTPPRPAPTTTPPRPAPTTTPTPAPTTTPTAPQQQPPAPPTRAPGGTTATVGVPDMRPPVVGGPSARGVAIGAGITLAFQGLNFAFGWLNDREQARRVQEALAQLESSIAQERSQSPSIGHLLIFFYHRVTPDPDSLLQPGAVFSHIETGRGRTRDEALDQWRNQPKMRSEERARPETSTQEAWIPPVRPASVAAIRTPFRRVGIGTFAAGRARLQEVEWGGANGFDDESEDALTVPAGLTPQFLILAVPNPIRWSWGPTEMTSRVPLVERSAAEGGNLSAVDLDPVLPGFNVSAVCVFPADDETAALFATSRPTKDNLGQLRYANIGRARWVRPENVRVLRRF